MYNIGACSVIYTFSWHLILKCDIGDGIISVQSTVRVWLFVVLNRLCKVLITGDLRQIRLSCIKHLNYQIACVSI